MLNGYAHIFMCKNTPPSLLKIKTPKSRDPLKVAIGKAGKSDSKEGLYPRNFTLNLI